jgi:hypothetical protein
MEPASVSPQFNPVAAYADQQQAGVAARRAEEDARQTRATREVVAEVGDRVTLSDGARRDAAANSATTRTTSEANGADVREQRLRADAVQRREAEQPEQTPRSVTRAIEAYSQTNALN